MILDKAGLVAYPSSVVSQATAACGAAMAQLPSGPNSVS